MNRSRQYLLSYHHFVPWLLGVAMLLLSIGMVYFGWQWQTMRQQQASVDAQQLPKTLANDDYRMALHTAYQLSQQALNADNVKKMMQALTIAEASPDQTERGLANFMRGNFYYDLSKISQNIAAGGAHQQAVAQIELAREAYKRSIRLMPDFYDARFNLELLDRLSPEKRKQGWQGGVDGVTLQPFKQNGTAMMRDNERRGLP